MGKAAQPISHTWDGEQLTVEYKDGVSFVVDGIQPDSYGRLWAQIRAKVGPDVANQARIDLLDQRQRIDFEAVAHRRDGRVEWQSLLVPVIPLAQQGPPQESKAQPPGESWPVLPSKALHGLAGIMTLAIDPYTEADPSAILLNILTAFCNIVGSGTRCGSL